MGLLKPTRRTKDGQRRYSVADIDRLEFILHSRQFGFSLEAIRELLELSSGARGSCKSATNVAQRQECIGAETVAAARTKEGIRTDGKGVPMQ
ncbi:MerR family transcriptional regulator [Sulfitobacter sp.]|uniref:MerR family transcriptional regulator n=1 Tax=Sulfitobacter sp. TaxID=1903071 RepID=UPI0040592C58